MASLQLTFDDGPQPLSALQPILDELAVRNLKGAFFVEGMEVAADPASTQKIVQAGHVLGNHSWDHLEPSTNKYSDAQIKDQFQRTHDAVSTSVHQTMRHWRAPRLQEIPRLAALLTSGANPLYSLSHCDAHGIANDSQGATTAPAMLAAIRSSLALHPKVASPRLLFHVLDTTAHALKTVLDSLAGEGHTFVDFKQEPKKVTILLTFDDGPDTRDPVVGGPLSVNRTETVLASLGNPQPPGKPSPGPIKAAFFVQTHVPFHMGSARGRAVATTTHSQDHVLAIHTGSKADHMCHKIRVEDPAEAPFANLANGLESDMARAKVALTTITGGAPEFVRATYGYTNKKCMEVYARQGLRHIYWHIKADDIPRKDAQKLGVKSDPKKGDYSPEITSELLRLFTRQKLQEPDWLKNGKQTLVYLFHDPHPVTHKSLDRYIGVIIESVQAAGFEPVFTKTRAEVIAALPAIERKGTEKERCPEEKVSQE